MGKFLDYLMKNKSVAEKLEEVSTQKAQEKAQEIHAVWLDEFEKAKKKDEGQDPKSFFYDPFQLVEAMGYKERVMPISYDTLRIMADRNPVVASVINTRVNQVASFSKPPRTRYDIGYEFVLRDMDATPTAKDKARMKELSAMIESTGFVPAVEEEARDDFDTFLRKVTRDTLTYDQLTFEIVPGRNKLPAAFYAIDAATIRYATRSKFWKDVAGQRGGGYLNVEKIYQGQSDMHSTFTSDWSSQMERVGHMNLRTDDVKYVQLVNGRVVNVYTEKEICFGVRNPRTNIRQNGYGVSELEILINTVTAHLWTEEYNRRFFSQGSAPKGIIHFEGSAVQQDQLNAFRRQWHAQVAGVYNSWRTPIIASPAKLQYTNLQFNNRQMQFAEWMEYLIKVICSVFLIDPVEINFDIMRGAGMANAPTFESRQEAKQKMSRDRGLKPLLKFIEAEINKNVIWQIEPRYEFQFVGLDRQSEGELLELKIKEIQNFKKLDEVRTEFDLPKLGEDKGGDLILNPSYISYLTQKAMQEQMAGGAGGPGGPGGPGGGPEEGGGGFDFGQQGEEAARVGAGGLDFGQEETPEEGGEEEEE